MKKIFKFPLVVCNYQEISIPKGSTILTVNMQAKHPHLWAEVDTAMELENRGFEMFGTGFTIPEDMGVSREYVGTFFDGGFVWHLYERKN